MPQTNSAQRWRRIKFLFGLALIGAIISLVVFNYKESPIPPAALRERVFEEFSQGLLDKTARIRITIPDSSFQIIKDETGKWVMPERGNFQVSDEKLKRFETDIKYLYKLEHRTSDPSQFDRLGVGEPKEFGEGTTIEFFDNSGRLITASSLGQIGSLIFVRKTGALEVYSAQGQLMDVSKKSNWLDFGFLRISPPAISIVSIDKSGASPYTIARDSSGSFRLGNTQFGARIDEAAEFISRIEPINVIESEKIGTSPRLVQTILLRDGNTLILSLFKQNGSFWVKIDASKMQKPSTLLAPDFPTKTKEWAFEISEGAAEILELSQEELGLRGTLKN